MQAVFVLHLLYFTYKQLKGMFTLRKKFFGDPWNVFDLAIMSMDWTIMGTTIARLVLTDFTIAAFHENKSKFIGV